MAEELGKPVSGVAQCADTDMSKWASRDSRGVARRLTTTDHAEGRHIVGARGQAGPPVFVQRSGCDEMRFSAPAEKLVVDGTAATLVKLGMSDSVTEPQMAAPAGDPTPPRGPIQQPQAPQAIVSMPVAPGPIQAATHDRVAAPAPAKKLVTIQGEGIGKLRVFCQDVIISDKLVVLCYPLDGSTAIVEPPSTDSLKITVDNITYECAARDMSFEHAGVLMVVLIKVS